MTVLLAGATLTCVDSTGPAFPLIEATEFAPSLAVDLSRMTRIGGGMYVLDIEPGAGPAVEPDHRVEVAYAVRLADGRLVEVEESLRFRTGCREVMAGLEAALRGMRPGGVRRAIVPGRLGYGLRPPPDSGIPIGAVLVVDVELISTRVIEDPRECRPT